MEWYPPLPAPSLRELARPKGVTEGVSPDEWQKPKSFELRRGDENRPPTPRFSEYPVGWYSPPGSLSEGAGSPIGLTEGVSSDGCFGSMGLLTGFLLSLKLLSVYVHRSTLPQGGSRGWLVPFIGVLAKILRYGRFSSPLRSSECLTVPIHRGTLPQSRPLGVTAPSEREPGNVPIQPGAR